MSKYSKKDLLYPKAGVARPLVDMGAGATHDTYTESFAKRQEEEERKRQRNEAYQMAVELAKNSASSSSDVSTVNTVNAGDNRTTAVNPYTYQKPNANATQSYASNYAAAQPTYTPPTNVKKNISEKESLDYATTAVTPYLKDEATKKLLDRYVELETQHENAKAHSGIRWMPHIDKLMFGNQIDEVKAQIKEQTGISDEELENLTSSYKYYADYYNNEKMKEEIDKLPLGVKLAASPLVLAEDITANATGLFSVKDSESTNPNLGRNYNSGAFSNRNIANAVRESVHNDIDESVENPILNTIANKAYDIPMMAAESLVTNFAGPAGLATFGTGAYAENLREAENRGLDERQAKAYAGVMGITEVATEAIPFNNLSRLIRNGASKEAVKGAILPYFKEVGKQMLEEGGEEAINDVVDIIADGLINGDQSKLNNSINAYINEGYSEEDARAKAYGDQVLQIVDDFATGALSGGLSAGAAVGIHGIAETQAGREIAKNSELNKALVRDAQSADYISDERDDYNSEEEYQAALDARQTILNASEKAAKGERISGREARKVYSKTVEALASRNDNRTVPEEYRNKKVTQEEAIENIRWASDPYKLAMAVESVANMTDEVKEEIASTVDKLKSFNFTQEDIDNAITPQQAFKLGKEGQTVSEDQLKAIPEIYREQVKQANNHANNQQVIANNPTALMDKESSKAFVPEKVEARGDEVVVIDQDGNEHTDFYSPTLNAADAFADKYNTTVEQQALATELVINSPNARPAQVLTALEQIRRAASIGNKSWDAFSKSFIFDNDIINKDVAHRLYESIRSASERADIQKESSATVKNEGKVSKGAEEALNKQSEALTELVKAYAKKTGIDIKAFTNNSDNRGVYTPSTGEIKLNTTHADNAFSVFTHEGIGEFLQRYNRKDFKAIQDDILEYLESEMGTNDFNALVDEYQRAYRAEAKKGSVDYNKSRREAANEMVNDTLFALFATEEGLKDFTNWVTDNKSDTEQVSIFTRIKDFFDNLVQYIKDFIEAGSFNKAERAVLTMELKKAQDLRAQILAAMDEAIANRDAAVGEQGESAPKNAEEIVNSVQEEGAKSIKVDVPVSANDELVAIHNLSPEQMLADIKLGGFPSPSIAVIRADMSHDKYGDVSVVFGRDTIDPKSNKKNKVYGGDAYTPTFPTIEYKINEKRLDEIKNIIRSLAGTAENDLGYIGLDTDNLEYYLNSRNGVIQDTKYFDDPVIKVAFLNDKSIKYRTEYQTKRLSNKFDNEEVKRFSDAALFDIAEAKQDYEYGQKNPEVLNDVRKWLNKWWKENFDVEDFYTEKNFDSFDLYELCQAAYKYRQHGETQTVNKFDTVASINGRIEHNLKEYRRWFDDLFKGIVEKEGIRNNKEAITRNGRRSWDSLHDEVTLDNIIKAMNFREAKGDALFSQSALLAVATKDFKSIKDIKNNIYMLNFLSDEEYKKISDELIKRANKIATQMANPNADNPYTELDNVYDLMADTIRTKKTAAAIYEELSKWNKKATPEIAKELEQLVEDISNRATGYFEAKPERAVSMDEILNVIVPSDETELINALKENDIPYATYQRGNSEDRANAVNLTENARFSKTVGDVEKKAIEHFGTTDSFRVAGYMLQDGTLLDFSGAHWLEGEDPAYIADWKSKNDIRQVDHEDIYEVMEASGDNRKQFMDRGNIRLSPEAPGFNISSKVEPTPAQYRELKEFIREIKRNPYYDASRFYIDIEDTHPNKISYANNLNEDRIINDIKHYYETGELPQQNALDNFRYSKKITLPDGRKVEYLADVLTSTEYNRLKEMIDSGYPAFKSADGDAVYRLDNKLVYARGKENFGISKIIEANVDNDADATYILDWFTDEEEKGATYEQQRTVIEDLFTEGSINQYTNEMFGYVSRYDRPTKRGKSRSDAYFAQREQNGARVYIKDGETLEQPIIEKRKSIKIDSAGNTLTEGQQEYFADSKIRDDEGRLMVMYHGTNNYGFTVFDKKKAKYSGLYGRGFYFSPVASHAGQYGKQYEVYLNITNPLKSGDHNITKDQLKAFIAAVAEDEDYGIENYGYDATVDSVTDDIWEHEDDFAMLQDVNAACVGDFVAAVKLFNEINGTDYDGITLPSETVAFEANQIKNIDNENPTADNDIRYSINIDEDRIYNYRGVEIVKNPTEAEYRAMRKEIKEQRPWLRDDEPLLRKTYDEEGNEYYWEALAGMHRTIEPAIRKHWGVRVAQNYEWWKDEDKYFWPNYYEERYSKVVMGEASPYADSLNESKVIQTLIGSMNNALAKADVFAMPNDELLRIERYLANKYKTNLEEGTIAANVSYAFAYMQRNKLDTNYESMMNYLLNIGDEIIKNSQLKDPDSEKLYNDAKKVLLGHKFKLTDADKAEISKAFGGSWNNAFGALQKAGIKLDNTKGFFIDEISSQLESELLKAASISTDLANKTPADQFLALLDTMTALEPTAYLWDGANDMDKALTVVADIVDLYYTAATEQMESNVAAKNAKGKEQIKKAIDKEKARLRGEFSKYKNEKSEEFNQIVAEKNRIIQQQQNELRAQTEQMKQWNAELSNQKKDQLLTSKQMQINAKLQAKQALQSYKEREERAKQIDNIRKTGIRLIKWLDNPTEKQHVPAFLQRPLGEFLAAIDFLPKNAKADSKNTLSWQQRMNDLRDVLIKIREAEITGEDSPEAYFAQSIIAKDLLAMMDDFLGKETWDEFTMSYISTKREAKKVSLLDAKELATLNKIMSSLSAAINNMNKTYANEYFKDMDALARASYAELREMKQEKEKMYSFVRKLKGFYIGDKTPVYFFEELGKGAKSVFDALRKGWNRRTEHIREASEHFEEFKKKNNISNSEISKWSKHVNKFELSEGTIELTDTQIMSLYRIVNRKQGRPHVMLGGIKPADTKIKGKSTHKNKSVHINPADYNKIISVLSDEQIKVADELQRYMANECSTWGNRVAREMFGYEKFTEQDYFPLKTDAHSRAVTNATENNVNYNTIKNSSFTKNIVPNANNAVMLEDIFDVFASHVEQMANYDGFVMPIADAMRWYNYSEKIITAAEEGSRVDIVSNMQQAIEAVVGTAGSKYFRTFIKNINGIYEGKGGDIELLNTLASGYKAQAVMANARVVAQQPTAIARAAMLIEDKYILKALVPHIGESYAKKAQKNSALAYWKAQGYYETMIGQSLKAIITGEQSLKDKINEIGGWAAGKADDITWGVLYRATELKVSKEHPELKYDSEEYTAEVVKQFEDIIDHTQVIDTIFHKSEFMRSANPVARMATAFMAEPTLTINIAAHSLHEAGIEYAKGHKKAAASILSKSVRVLATNALLVSLAQSIFDALRDDEDEELRKKLLKYWFGITDDMSAKDVLLSNVVDNLNPLNWIPVAKEIMSYIQGYDASNMYVDAIYSAGDTISELVKIAQGKSTKTPYGQLYTAAKGLSQISGIPVSNVIREIRTLNNNLNDLWNGEDWLTTQNAVKKQEKKKATNEFHKAYESMDSAIVKSAMQDIYNKAIDSGKEESEAWSAVRDALKTEFQAQIEAHPEDKAAIINRFKMLLGNTKRSDGKGGYRKQTDKESQNNINSWLGAAE